jgi:hypothetical protein
MDLKQRGAGHAVLQSSPRSLPKRVPPGGEPLVKRLHPTPEGEDLRT